MTVQRREFLVGASVATLLATVCKDAFAQAEMLTIVCPYASGGSADVLARRVANKFPSGNSRAVIVENKSGASGRLGVQYAKSQPANGSVILESAAIAFTLFPFTFRNLPYDPDKDFVPLTMAASYEQGLAVGPAVPASVKTVPDYLAWAKANPQSRSFGTTGAGSILHFIGAMLAKQAGVPLVHVPYRGGAAVLIDVFGGNLPAAILPVSDFLPHLQSGKIRILGTSGEKRSRFLPGQIPTFTEQGLKQMIHKGYYAFFVRSGTSQAIIEKLNAALRSALSDKDVVDGLAGYGMEAFSTTPQTAAELLAQDKSKWKAIVKEVGYTED